MVLLIKTLGKASKGLHVEFSRKNVRLVNSDILHLVGHRTVLPLYLEFTTAVKKEQRSGQAIVVDKADAKVAFMAPQIARPRFPEW